jgi:hypothetical protein
MSITLVRTPRPGAPSPAVRTRAEAGPEAGTVAGGPKEDPGAAVSFGERVTGASIEERL